MQGDTVISVRNLGKRYRLGVVGTGWLVRDLQSWWARRRGREDPNAVVGRADERITGDVVQALRGVSFEVGRGEVLGIIGKNGAGKSTLLKIMTRVTSAGEGEVRLRGRVASLLEVGTGFHPELTGRENVYLNGAILGMSRAEIHAKFDEIVAFSEVGRYIDTPVKRYSSGMYVRLAFAVAAHLNSEILLVDEVLAVGDADFQSKCRRKMQEISRSGRTILFVSHNMAAMQALCTRALLLDEGRVVFDGAVHEAVNRYLSLRPAGGGVLRGAALDERSNGQDRIDDPYFRCAEIALVDADGTPRDQFLSSEAVYVRVRFACLRRVPNFVLVMMLLGENNTPVLRSESLDDADPEAPRELAPGEYEAVCAVPPRTLGPGCFAVTVNIQYYPVSHLAYHEALQLRIDYQPHNYLSPTDPRRGNAPVWPRLAWTRRELAPGEAP